MIPIATFYSEVLQAKFTISALHWQPRLFIQQTPIYWMLLNQNTNKYHDTLISWYSLSSLQCAECKKYYDKSLNCICTRCMAKLLKVFHCTMQEITFYSKGLMSPNEKLIPYYLDLGFEYHATTDYTAHLSWTDPNGK